MCTINPLMCWYYDNLDYWEEHPEEYKKTISKPLPNGFNEIIYKKVLKWRKQKASI